MNGLKDAADDDLILVSDVDEIFSPDTVRAINPRALCTTIHQNVFNYQFNLRVHNTDGTPRKCTLPARRPITTLSISSTVSLNLSETGSVRAKIKTGHGLNGTG